MLSAPTCEGLVADNLLIDIPLTLTFHSSIFEAGSDKYILSVEGLEWFCIVITLNTAKNTFQLDTGSTTVHTLYCQVNNPTLYTNLIRVNPAVDRGIIDSAKGTDGRIRIHTQSCTYLCVKSESSVLCTHQPYSYRIPFVFGVL